MGNKCCSTGNVILNDEVKVRLKETLDNLSQNPPGSGERRPKRRLRDDRVERIAIDHHVRNRSGGADDIGIGFGNTDVTFVAQRHELACDRGDRIDITP